MANTFEVRVWCEDATLIGYATVQRRQVIVESGRYSMNVEDAPSNSGYLWPAFGFETRDAAESYAREWAEGLRDWAQEACGCDDNDCTHIQVCRDGYTVDE